MGDVVILWAVLHGNKERTGPHSLCTVAVAALVAGGRSEVCHLRYRSTYMTTFSFLKYTQWLLFPLINLFVNGFLL